MGVIHGNDSSNNLVPLLVDATGKPIVTGTLTVQGTNSDKLWSYSGAVYYENDAVIAPGGTFYILLVTVPAGFIHHIISGTFSYTGTVAGVLIYFIVYHGGNRYVVTAGQAPTSGTGYRIDIDVYMDPGDYIDLLVINSTAGDTIGVEINGYSMHNT